MQTVRKREEADPVPFTFAGCADESSATPGSTACSTQDVGNCVEVTDGSRIQNRYQDKSGAAAAGPIAQSQLFAVTPVSTSTQGPPRTEPTLPGGLTRSAHTVSLCVCWCCYRRRVRWYLHAVSALLCCLYSLTCRPIFAPCISYELPC